MLVDAVWGDRLPAHPQAALHTQLSRVRALLGPAADGLRLDTLGYALALERATVDAWDFEDIVGAVPSDGRSISTLTGALSLWDGRAFSDAQGHPAVQPAATHLEELRKRTIEDLARSHAAAGAPEVALSVIDPLLAEDPYRDGARAIELRALAATGRTVEALARYQDHRKRLAEELGIDPSPLLQRVEHEILSVTPPRETGGSRAHGTPPALPVTSFIGRERELQSVRELLRCARVVTIVGPAGSGKTRLALHAAHEAHADYREGVWWCDLAPASPGEVATVVATRLGVQERSGESEVDRLASFLGDRRVLLVLDNCEHVVADARELVDTVVRRGPALHVLATSTQPLGVDGEHQLRLGPLSLSGGADASHAVELFLDRARAAAPGFDPHGPAWSATVEVCRHVGGLPLAIELAAACITRIDVGALALRIGDHIGLIDRPGSVSSDRHRSLEGILESSYGLLDVEERSLLDRLAVFAGPFTLDDAEDLGGGDPRPGHLAKRLGVLVVKSMVLFRHTDGRYELLPPVQALCRSHLAAGGQRDRWQARHADIVVEKAGTIDRALRSADEQRFSSVFDDAIAELRTARSWLAQTDDVAHLVELSARLHWFAMLRTRSEMYRWAEDALVRAGEDAHHPGMGPVRACAANGAAKRGDLARARAFADLGARAEGDDRRFCVEVLAQIDLFDGRLDDAVARSRRAVELHDGAGDRLHAVNAATVEAVALAYGGRLEEAEALARTLVRAGDVIGVPSLRAMTRYILAETIAEAASAVRTYQESIDLAASVGAEFVTGLANTSLAARLLRSGDHRLARQRLGSVIDHWQRHGVRNQLWLAIRLLIEALDHDAQHESVAVLAGAYTASTFAGPAYGDDATRLDDAVRNARLKLGPAAFAAAQQRGATMTDDQAGIYAQSLTPT